MMRAAVQRPALIRAGRFVRLVGGAKSHAG